MWICPPSLAKVPALLRRMLVATFAAGGRYCTCTLQHRVLFIRGGFKIKGPCEVGRAQYPKVLNYLFLKIKILVNYWHDEHTNLKCTDIWGLGTRRVNLTDTRRKCNIPPLYFIVKSLNGNLLRIYGCVTSGCKVNNFVKEMLGKGLKMFSFLHWLVYCVKHSTCKPNTLRFYCT